MTPQAPVPKIIHFPGGNGQRRQARYLIVAGAGVSPGVVLDTKIVFIEDVDDPSKRDPGWETVLSNDTDSIIIPSYLVNKVLEQELSGCRLDFIKVFFVMGPNPAKRRDVYRWDFTVDREGPVGDDPFRTTLRIYPSHWDRIKALLRIPGAEWETKGLTDRQPCAGIYPVIVAIDKPMLLNEERAVILEVAGLATVVAR